MCIHKICDFFETNGVTIVGGRPGIGVTTLLLNVSGAFAREGKQVLFVSPRIPVEQLISARIGVLHEALSSVAKGVDHVDRAAGHRICLEHAPIESIQNLMEKAEQCGKLDLVIIDGIEDLIDRFSSDREIVFSLWNLKRVLDCPVVLSCKVKRCAERRRGHLPVKKDLKRCRSTFGFRQQGYLLFTRESYYRPLEEQHGEDCQDWICRCVGGRKEETVCLRYGKDFVCGWL